VKKTIRMKIDGEIVDITAERNGNTVTVTRDGHTVSVELVEDTVPEAPAPHTPGPSPAAVATPAPAAPPVATASAVPAGPGTVTAPMIGTIKELLAGVGDAVEIGQQVLMMEAMKMDIEISSPSAGSVTEVYVKPGDTVKEGQPLMKVG